MQEGRFLLSCHPVTDIVSVNLRGCGKHRFVSQALAQKQD